MNNRYNLFFVFSLLLLSCSPSINEYITYVSFNNKTYSPTIPSNINIYNSRIELPDKYIEIGTLKFEGSPGIDKIIQKAADIGAMALIKEGNNYILFIFPNKMKAVSDGKTI